jgi:hypothetical protein
MSFRKRYDAHLDTVVLRQDVVAYRIGGLPPSVFHVRFRHESTDGTAYFALRHRTSGRHLLLADAAGAFVGDGDRLIIRVGPWVMVRLADPIPHGPPVRLATEVLAALTTPPRKRPTVNYPGYRRAWWVADRFLTTGLLAAGIIEKVDRNGE